MGDNPNEKTKVVALLTPAEQETKDKNTKCGDMDVNGVGLTKLLERVPAFAKLPGEKVIAGQNNTWIVLGRDRPGSPLSGVGCGTASSAGTIDIVAGRLTDPKLKDKALASVMQQNINQQGKGGMPKLQAHPSIRHDASRIYISAKTHVDKNFNIKEADKISEHKFEKWFEEKFKNNKNNANPTAVDPKAAKRYSIGTKGDTPSPRAAIAMKSDNIRIIAREGIKLVTGTDLTWADGGRIEVPDGIHLIANNTKGEQQPMVLGDNLVTALKGIIEHVDMVASTLHCFLIAQLNYNIKVAQHYHVDPLSKALGLVAVQNKDAIPDLQSFQTHAAAFKFAIDTIKNTYPNLTFQKIQNPLMEAKYLFKGSRDSVLSDWNTLN